MGIEELQEQILALQEKNKAMAEDLENYKALTEEKDKRVLELTEFNQKLFSRVVSSSENIKNEEKQFESKLLSKEHLEMLSDDEIKLLQEIEEEV